MKRSSIFRIFALIFALILTFSLASCSGEGEETTAPIPETDPPTEAPDTTEAPAPDLDLHVISDGASDYVAVRPESAESYELTAIKDLKSLIKDKYGIDLALDTDGKRKPGTDPEYQILIGRTDEPESASAIIIGLLRSSFASLKQGKA